MPPRLTATIDAVGGDVAQLTSDPEFMEGVRNLTIGLGELFGEILSCTNRSLSTISSRYWCDFDSISCF